MRKWKAFSFKSFLLSKLTDLDIPKMGGGLGFHQLWGYVRSWQVFSTGLCRCPLTSVHCSLPAWGPLVCVSGDLQVCARQRIRLECRQPNRKRKVIASSHTGQISFLQRKKSRFNFQLSLNSSLSLSLLLSPLPSSCPFFFSPSPISTTLLNCLFWVLSVSSQQLS